MVFAAGNRLKQERNDPVGNSFLKECGLLPVRPQRNDSFIQAIICDRYGMIKFLVNFNQSIFYFNMYWSASRLKSATC